MTSQEREHLRELLEKFERWLNDGHGDPPTAEDTRKLVSFAVWQFARLAREAEKDGRDHDPFRFSRLDRYAAAALPAVIQTFYGRETAATPEAVAREAWLLAEALEAERPGFRTGLPLAGSR